MLDNLMLTVASLGLGFALVLVVLANKDGPVRCEPVRVKQLQVGEYSCTTDAGQQCWYYKGRVVYTSPRKSTF